MSNKILIIFSMSALLFSTVYATEKNHFTIAIDPEYIPFTQKDIDGNPTGLLVDLWNLWAKKNGYTVEYKFYPWEETLIATQKGEVDFHSGTTQDRAWMRASKTVYSLRTGVFTLGESHITTVKDLQNIRLGTIDSYYADIVKKVVGEEIAVMIYDDYKPMMEALKKKKIEAVVDDVEAVVYYLIKTGQLSRFSMLDDESLQFVNDIYAITNEKNSPLLKQINSGLAKLTLDELVTIEKVWIPRIDEAYYTKQLRAETESSWVFIVSTLVGLFLLLTGYYIYMMREKHRYTTQLLEKMELLTLTDDLTELSNKRAFNQNFETIHDDKQMLGLLFIDIDYFKMYNDHYGHLKGDEVLKKVAKVIDSFATEDAYSYRIGGEEFGLILYDYDEDRAVAYAEKISKTIYQQNFEHIESPLKCITVSIGVAVTKPLIDRHILYQCADQALYAAKEVGRNRVVLNPCMA